MCYDLERSAVVIRFLLNTRVLRFLSLVVISVCIFLTRYPLSFSVKFPSGRERKPNFFQLKNSFIPKRARAMLFYAQYLPENYFNDFRARSRTRAQSAVAVSGCRLIFVVKCCVVKKCFLLLRHSS